MLGGIEIDNNEHLIEIGGEKEAEEYEELRQFEKALQCYTLCIQQLLTSYKAETNVTQQRFIKNRVTELLKRTDKIRELIEWQDNLDKQKTTFLEEERLYTEYFTDEEHAKRRISCPPPYEHPPSYQESINKEVSKAKSLSTLKTAPTHSLRDIYKRFQLEDTGSSKRKEIVVRPHLLPPEFIQMPIRPLPPVSYTISRSFSTYGKEIRKQHQMAERAKSTTSILKRQSIKMGKSYEEMTDMIRYMLSTDPFETNEQLPTQLFHFNDNQMENSSLTYQAKFSFTFKDFSQFLFRKLRRQNNIDCDHYVHSLASDPDGLSLAVMLAEGKSSANFFRSENGEFVIKTLTEAELDFLQQILPSYIKYVTQHPNTFLCRFYGLHQIQAANDEPINFLVMENLIPTYPGITRYDLKGSKYGRAATPEEKRDGGVLKDNDFRVPFIIDSKFQQRFFQQLEFDCEWLCSHTIMDYSFLVGVEQRPAMEFPFELSITKSPSIFKEESGAFRSRDENGTPLDTIYYTGIIDILQPYNMRKKVEHAIKSITESSTDISCVEPTIYATRFINFLRDNTASVISMTPTPTDEERLAY